MADAESSKLQRKQKYFSKLIKLLDEYPKIIIVSCTNVGSYSLQKIRKTLRNDAIILMGKNVCYIESTVVYSLYSFCQY
jgi:ribosomal protein L10